MRGLSIAFAALLVTGMVQRADAQQHNVILFVPDGLRGGMVTAENAPAMFALARDGVTFTNSHSLFPTLTTPNASGLSTGHYLGDTGDFGNTLYAGFPVPAAHNSVTPFIENDDVLGQLDKHFNGNFIHEESVLHAAQAQGYVTAAVGKLGPTLIWDHQNRDGQKTIIIDDRTGNLDGIDLPSWLAESMTMNNITVRTPSRGANGDPLTKEADIQQLTYFSKVINELLLPKFKQDGKPFFLIYWSRDPDGSQHNQGDSLNELTPGINGPTSLAAIRNADNQVAKLREALQKLGLAATTDILIAADHGFSTISKQSRTSVAAKGQYELVPPGSLPPGFVALDLADALKLPFFDPDHDNQRVEAGQTSRAGNGLLGTDPEHPDLVVVANGGADMVYFPKKNGKKLAEKVIAALLREDYVSGIFVDPALGKFAGTLPMNSINLVGKAVTQMPSILVNFRTEAVGCAIATNCQVQIADSVLPQGSGMHGSFGRGDTFNFMAAIGPDFKSGYKDSMPVSNADVGMTIASLLKLKIPAQGKLLGRVMSEALLGGKEAPVMKMSEESKPDANGLKTILRLQKTGDQLYFDAAGFKGRTVGLDDSASP
jgi:arylsulfatase A-like enzyme